ncbi:MAG: hypothetical protein RL685_6079 [Pseudomonadota bacterium]
MCYAAQLLADANWLCYTCQMAAIRRPPFPSPSSQSAPGSVRLHERVNEVRSGLPYAELARLQAAVDLSAAETAKVLGIPERTLARRKDGKLTAEESDRLDRITRVFELGCTVLGEESKIRAWLHAPNRALGGVVPLELLDTDRGVRAVEDVLLRIEHGIHG